MKKPKEAGTVAPDPGRLTRAAIHTEAGEAELRMSAAGNWQLAIRRAEQREWQLACSGDLNGGGGASLALPEEQPVCLGKLRLDIEQHRVFAGSHEVALSKLEFRLLALLASRPHRAFSKAELLKTIWGCDGIRTRTVDSNASRLRNKLRRAGAPGYVINIQGVGYKLLDGPAPSGSGEDTAR